MRPEDLVRELKEQVTAHESALEHMAGSVNEACHMCGGQNFEGQGMGLPYHAECACAPVRKAIRRAKTMVTRFRNQGISDATFTNGEGVKARVKVKFTGKWFYSLKVNGCTEVASDLIPNPWNDMPGNLLNEERDADIKPGFP